MGKTTAATDVAARYGCSVLSVDAIWLALKAVTSRDSDPELHYFELSDEELSLAAECLCELHIECSLTISQAMDPVIEHLLWEQKHLPTGQRPIVLEGAWITPAAAGRWTHQYKAVRAAFIHEPKRDSSSGGDARAN